MITSARSFSSKTAELPLTAGQEVFASLCSNCSDSHSDPVTLCLAGNQTLSPASHLCMQAISQLHHSDPLASMSHRSVALLHARSRILPSTLQVTASMLLICPIYKLTTTSLSVSRQSFVQHRTTRNQYSHDGADSSAVALPHAPEPRLTADVPQLQRHRVQSYRLY